MNQKNKKEKKRAKPGTGGSGEYYRIEVEEKEKFDSFRYHDIGERGGDLERLAGKKDDGAWNTQAWLINKKSAHIEKDKLIPDSQDVKDLFKKLRTKPKHLKGDIFTSKEKSSKKKK